MRILHHVPHRGYLPAEDTGGHVVRAAQMITALRTLGHDVIALDEPVAVLSPAGAVAKPAAPVTTGSGLIFKLIQQGSGPSPLATDTVKVHYSGTFTDGREFDSSYKRGTPASFPLNRVIKCWTEGVQRIKVGGKAKLTCPAAIAYGENGRGDIPGGATLQFEVELLGINGQ